VNSAGNGCEAASSGGNSCRYAYDGECDDGSQGGSRYCDRGTDEADCGQGSGTVTASSMQHCLNRQASSWFLHRVEDVGCAYISGGCSPCCSALGYVLDETINDYLVAKGDQVMTRAEDWALDFVQNHIFS
jgi:hypothetical protein